MRDLSHFEEVDESKSIFGKDLDKDREVFLDYVRKYEPDANYAFVTRAFDFCVEKHHGVYRKSGLPYYTHPLNVTIILLEEFPIHDTDTIVAALLHDTIEDCEDVSKETLAEEFNDHIADLVEALTKIKHENISRSATGSKEKDRALTYRKLFLSLVQDIRVIVVKIADRLHNMRTLHYMAEYKRGKVAQETLNFYVPFAHRLGLMKIKMELENRSFYFSDNEKYEAIRSELDKKRWSFIDYINVFSNIITKNLNDNNIDHIITVVHKHEYEIYKIIQEGKQLGDIDNFYSLVIILQTDNPNECYHAYGVLTNAFKTIQFLDEIAYPTVDWYKSLRLDVMGPAGKRVEILIRTEEMERVAEEGFLNSYNRNEADFRPLQFKDQDVLEWGEWMESIIETEGEDATPTIWNSMKANIFDSALSVYTKDGREVRLPNDSTMLDFSFAMHGDDAIHTIAGKVNGKTADLKYKLNQGDQVEIIKSPNYFPEKEWPDNVIYYKAVVKLHKYFSDNPDELNRDGGIGSAEKDVKLIIRGEDRSKMLSDITEVIGKKYIKRIYLGASGAFFEGILTIRIIHDSELNHLFLKLFEVKGISGVFVEEADEIEDISS